jgi:hypothetical protein
LAEQPAPVAQRPLPAVLADRAPALAVRQLLPQEQDLQEMRLAESPL